MRILMINAAFTRQRYEACSLFPTEKYSFICQNDWCSGWRACCVIANGMQIYRIKGIWKQALIADFLKIDAAKM